MEESIIHYWCTFLQIKMMCNSALTQFILQNTIYCYFYFDSKRKQLYLTLSNKVTLTSNIEILQLYGLGFIGFFLSYFIKHCKINKTPTHQ